MRVRLTHIDGKLPNLALMKLAHWHGTRGDSIHFTKSVARELEEGDYDRVYGSAIFSVSVDRVHEFRSQWPDAILGGTHDLGSLTTVEEFLGVDEYEHYDYSIYPRFDASIGFTQRGCRLKCGFCVVPKKEGKPRSVNTVATIWRGGDYPKHLHLLDNDFFGQPREDWEARVDEILTGKFKVCLNQGINVRLIDDESAKVLASLPYYDDAFKSRRIYTAWDNVGDEGRFFTGVDRLERAGIPPGHIMAYMLVGYDKRETWERVLYRFHKMVDRGIRPFPMIYGDRFRHLPAGGYNGRVAHKPIWEFQKWAVRRYYELIPAFENFDNNGVRADERQGALFSDVS